MRQTTEHPSATTIQNFENIGILYYLIIAGFLWYDGLLMKKLSTPSPQVTQSWYWPGSPLCWKKVLVREQKSQESSGMQLLRGKFNGNKPKLKNTDSQIFPTPHICPVSFKGKRRLLWRKYFVVLTNTIALVTNGRPWDR